MNRWINLTLILLVAASSPSNGNWTFSGPYRPGILAIYSDGNRPGTLYLAQVLGDDVGIFKSTNWGESWTKIMDAPEEGIYDARGIDFIDVEVLAYPSDPDVVFVWWSQEVYEDEFIGGLFTTRDGGTSWRREFDGNIEAKLTINPFDSEHVLFGSLNLYESRDGGQSFSENMGFANRPVGIGNQSSGNASTEAGFGGYTRDINVNPHNSNHWVVGSFLWGDNLSYRYYTHETTNSGETWEISNFSSVMTFDPVESGKMYSIGNGVWYTSDNGESWEGFGTNPYGSWEFAKSLLIHPIDNSILFVDTNVGIIRTKNGGAESLGEDVHSPALVLDSGQETLFGVYKEAELQVSHNRGDSWTAIPANFGGSLFEITAIATDPEVAGRAYIAGGGIYKTEDYGNSWQPLEYPHSASNEITGLAMAPDNNSEIYAAENYPPWRLRYVGNDVYRSDNFGEQGSWIALDARVYGKIQVSRANDKGARMLYVLYPFEKTSISLFRISASGAIQSAGQVRYAQNYHPTVVATDPRDHQIVYVGTVEYTVGFYEDDTPGTVYEAQGVLKSTNGGWSFSAVNNGLTDLNIHSLAIDPINPSSIYCGTLGGIFKSSNAGTSWSRMVEYTQGITFGGETAEVPLPAVTMAVSPRNPNIIYAGLAGIELSHPTSLAPARARYAARSRRRLNSAQPAPLHGLLRL